MYSSGSIEIVSDIRLQHFGRAVNYQIFRQSLIEILKDSGYGGEMSDEKETNAIALGALRTILGNEKLTIFLRNLIPTSINSN